MKDLFIRAAKINWDQIADNDIYPFSLPAIHNLKTLEFHQPVTFFSGGNGSGKSTLLEAMAIAYGFNPEGGSKNFTFHTTDSHSELYTYITLVKSSRHAKDCYFLRAESFYNLASEIDAFEDGLENAYGGESLHKVSHGEGFLNMALHRFFGDGVYMLDEAESALSPVGQFTLLRCIHQLVKETSSQFIIATHSPILMAYPDAEILEFEGEELHSVSYKQSSNYQLYRSFFDNPRILEELLKDDEQDGL